MLNNLIIGGVIYLTVFWFCDGSVRLEYHKMVSSSNNWWIPDKWFPQLLDHFQPTDTRIWYQRYAVVDAYYREDGPVFLYIEGEGEAYFSGTFSGAWVDYAKEYNALMFAVEHRYYGKSHPTRDLSVENLKYLTSEQALADLAYFIEGMNMNSTYELPPDTKWVVFGGSYPGNLAAWLRYKYPHLVHAAVASSGPLLATLDFPGYLDVVKEALRTYSSQCVEAVEAANRQVKTLMNTVYGRWYIEREFRLCDPIRFMNENDRTLTLDSMAGVIAGQVQSGDFNELCAIMVDEDLGSPVKRFAVVVNRYNGDCLPSNYEKFLKQMRKIAWSDNDNPGVADRQWAYQTCTEFGFFQSSRRRSALFGDDFPVEFFIQQCQDIFNKKFTKEFISRAVARSNLLYGGRDIKATRVVYVNGSLDPWHVLGITKTRIPESPAIFINGTSHCANMYAPKDTDTPDLIAAREEISTLIGKWLSET